MDETFGGRATGRKQPHSGKVVERAEAWDAFSFTSASKDGGTQQLLSL